jgi:hypothetical protein
VARCLGHAGDRETSGPLLSLTSRLESALGELALGLSELREDKKETEH